MENSDQPFRPRRLFADISHPKKDLDWAKNDGVLKRGSVLGSFKPEINEFNWTRFMKYAAIFPLVVILGYGIYFAVSKDSSVEAAKNLASNFKQLGKEAASFNTGSIGELLEKIKSDLTSLRGKTRILNLTPVLNEIPRAIGTVSEITERIESLNDNFEKLKTDGLRDLLTPGTEKNQTDLAAILKDVLKDLKDINQYSTELRNTAAKFELISQDIDLQYLTATNTLNNLIKALESAITIVDSEYERHFLVMFQNPTEIRPAGGFVGSYGDITMEKGSINNITVNDIYYATHFSTAKIVPPQQLQGITVKWSPQDANWFFDFPTSARKTAEFIESSSVYADKKIGYQGVISINVRLVEDFLRISGPIEIPEYQMVLNADNFLSEVQREVEQGRDKKPGQNPKKILTFIMPKLLDKLGNLPDEGKLKLIEVFKNRFANKDIQIYFKDPIFQSLLMQFGVAGEVYRLPNSFTGDYLAVVNANVAGGKSDLFMTQSIKLRSKIDPLGTLQNELRISRSHSGQGQKDWWYRSINQNYLKVFTSPGLEFQGAAGNSVKVVKPSINYVKSGYRVDPDLVSVESTKRLIADENVSLYKESGKDVMATWFNVKAGESRELVLNYSNSREIHLINGAKFEFIFEKQSGVETKLDYSIEAPSGFVWKETKSPEYNYVNDKVPGRLIITLTLKKEDAEKPFN